MAKRQQNVKKGSSRKVGSQKAKCESYRLRNVCQRNKIKRILQSNGAKAVESYKRNPTMKFPKERRK